MKLHYRRCMKKQGLTPLIQKGNSGLKYIGLNILRLAKGNTFKAKYNEQETAIVILSGSCNLEAGHETFFNIGRRKDVFSGKASTLYVPVGLSFKITARTLIEVALCTTSSLPRRQAGMKKSHPVLITPQMVKTRCVGQANWKRYVYDIIDKNMPADKLVLGETINPSGNWSSYPPHKHEQDTATESRHEEVYFYRLQPASGFGLQRVYTDSSSIDAAYVIKHNDVVAIPKGYHPVVAGGGYKLYYLWILAGKKRTLKPKDDPEHSWVKGG